MKIVIKKKKFVKDAIRIAKNNQKIIHDVREITHMLAKSEALPLKYKDHKLTGNWNGYRECHVRPDVLLIYKINDESLELIRLGSHAELFNI